MRNQNKFRTVTTLLLTVCLSLPFSVLADKEKKIDTKKAKKNYSEGLKYEVEQKWDLAAQSFLLAAVADPGNVEYQLHMRRAMEQASRMYGKRGDAFAAENDFASAYTAYKQSYAYDQTNEVMLVKMRRMVDLQRAAAGLTEAPNINPTNGNILPAKDDITTKTPQRTRSKDLATVIHYKDQPLKGVIQNIAKQLNLNVIFDETFRDEPKYNLELQNTTLARALDFIFIQKKLTFEQLDRRTILIYFDNPTNRQRFERLMVKTFYINNAKLEEARQVVQQMLQGGGAGLMRQIAASTQLNALIVRAPAEDLKMVQDVLDSIDKNRAEVAVDVEIFEVSHNASQQIGNQVAMDPTTYDAAIKTYDSRGNVISTTSEKVPVGGLNNLGGLGLKTITAAALGAAAGVNTLGLGTGFGMLLAAPPTTLSLLQNKTNAKSVGRVNIHAIDGQSNKTNVGRRVPVNLGYSYPAGYYPQTTAGVPGTTGTGTIGSALGGLSGLGGLGGGGISSFQYQDVGLNIDITPTVTGEGYIEMKMTLESSSVVPGSGGSTQTPEFTQRKLTTISRVLDGRTAVVAGVQQQTKSDGRSTIPVIGMLPILGRFITTPKESADMSDIVITVTPHIIRAPQLEKKDHLAKDSGTGLGGNFVSIEQVVMRAQDEDDQDRRIIAAQQGQPIAPAPVETATTVSAPLTQPAVAPVIPAVAQQMPPAPTPASQPLQEPQVKPQTAKAPPKPEKTPEPEPEQPAGAINGNNTDDGGVPAPTFEPPPGYTPRLMPPSLTPEQRANYEEMRAKAAEEAKKNPPPAPTAPTQDQGVPAPTFEPPAGYTPKLMPVVPPKKEKEKTTAPQAAKNDAKELSMAAPKSPVLEVRSNEADASAQPAVGLSLKLNKEKKLQMGETFIVVVAVDGKSKITGANIALNYNTNLLQLKSVRDGGMLGRTPDMTQQEKNGNLVVSVQQVTDRVTPVAANGKLLILEFKAIGAGQTMIGFNADETRFLLADKASPLFNTTPVQFEITRETISKLTK
ncbi:MAG: secretin N-terminal domain-containing protein [Blastocatellia bacterium]